MTLQEENILKSEVMLKIRVTSEKIKKLSYDTFPTMGPQKILLLSARILEQITSRYNDYNFNQLFFIKTGILKLIIKLISQIEYSTIKNVTWSIIPAYNSIFKSLLDDTEYIIVPQWEEKYSIRNKNLLEDFEGYLKTPDLIFKAGVSKETIGEITEGIPKKIYLIKYSRLEKLSALHMALLGHEIGHIFADKKFGDFVVYTKLNYRLGRIVSEELKKNPLVANMNKDYKNLEGQKILSEYSNLIIENYNELLSDLFGCALFGHTFIVAMYLYSSITADLDKSNWRIGYLSWRFRLQNCISFLSFVLDKYKISMETYDLYESICSTINEVEIKDKEAHEVCKLFIDSFQSKETEIFETICVYSKSELFVKRIDLTEIEAACDRLRHDIIPNAMLKEGIEYPIDIRNILLAIWLVSYEKNDEQDIQIFADRIKHYNLLGIKGIELSVEQGDYNDFVKGKTKRKT